MPGRRGPLHQGLPSQKHLQLPFEVLGRTAVPLPTFTLGITHARHNSVHLTVIINDLHTLVFLNIQHACSRTATIMSLKPFALVTPSTRGLSAALTKRLLAKSELPVYATYRQGNPERVKDELLRPLNGIDPSRLNMIHLDLEDETSIRSAAEKLDEMLPPDSYLHTGFFTGGILLNPEKQPGDVNLATVQKTFSVNVFSHLLLMKHFARFLPSASMASSLSDKPPAKWIHITARVGSIADNRKGGWYSYRASKAALNQTMHTFDLHLKQKNLPAMAVGIHPGTMKTELSKDFWKSTPKDRLREPDEAAERVLGVVERLGEDQRGRVWDWAGEEVVW